MNRIEGGWKQFMDNIKQQWRKLTDDLMACKAQESQGISRSQMAVWRERQERKDHPK